MVDIVGRAKVIVETDVDQNSVGRVGGFLERSLKGAAVGAGAAVGTLFGAALAKGFQRLSSIEEAEAKLSGLGNSAKTVTEVMENALDAVKGTAFGLGDAANVAASAVASGVKPGQELERTLRLVADASTIAGTDLNEMGAIFNKVAATGKIQGEVIAQLGERGIPIIQLLAKELGVTAEEVVKLASDGQISFATFQNAIEEGMGGAALKSGETFKGALANAGAALGRFGAALLGPTFKEGPDVFQSLTDKLDEMTPAAAKVGTQIGKLGDAIDKLSKSKEWKALKSDIKAFGGDLGTVAVALGRIISQVDKFSKYVSGKGLLAQFAEALGKITEYYAPLSKIADALELVADAWNRLNRVRGDDVPDAPDISQPRSTRAGGGRTRGLTLVGESGPELIEFGSQGGYVHNNSETRAIAGNAGGSTIVTNYNLYGPESLSQARRDNDWDQKYGTRFGSATSAAAL